MKRRTRRVLLAAAVVTGALAMVPSLGLLGLIAGDAALEYAGRERFDARAWRDSEKLEQGVRLRMVDDLFRRDLLVGRSRQELAELLGEPAPSGGFAGWDHAYWLGPERGFISIDSEWLVLRYDAHGVLAEASLARD